MDIKRLLELPNTTYYAKESKNGREFVGFDRYYRNGDEIIGHIETIAGTDFISDLGNTCFMARSSGGEKARLTNIPIIRIPITEDLFKPICSAFVDLCENIFNECVVIE